MPKNAPGFYNAVCTDCEQCGALAASTWVDESGYNRLFVCTGCKRDFMKNTLTND